MSPHVEPPLFLPEHGLVPVLVLLPPLLVRRHLRFQHGVLPPVGVEAVLHGLLPVLLLLQVPRVVVQGVVFHFRQRVPVLVRLALLVAEVPFRGVHVQTLMPEVHLLVGGVLPQDPLSQQDPELVGLAPLRPVCTRPHILTPVFHVFHVFPALFLHEHPFLDLLLDIPGLELLPVFVVPTPRVTALGPALQTFWALEKSPELIAVERRPHHLLSVRQALFLVTLHLFVEAAEVYLAPPVHHPVQH